MLAEDALAPRMNIDLRQVNLKRNAQKLVDELTDYRNRMQELGRSPVLRLKRKDYLFLRGAVMREKKIDTFDDLTLNGEKVSSA